jgi:5-methylcytosine-specific restriction endonuclease McrA
MKHRGDCQMCGAKIVSNSSRPHTRFCSPLCWNKRQRAGRKKRKCPICGNEFELSRYRNWRLKTCSRACGWKHERRRKILTCKHCGKDFETHHSSLHKYCSLKCSRAARPLKMTAFKCAGCGKAFERMTCQALRRDSKVKERFCSRECASSRRGPKHPMWRGRNYHYRGIDWPEKAAQARERDLHTCQVCGKIEKKDELLSVDHIVPFRMCLSNDLVNLISVCRAPCHARKTMYAEPCILKGDKLRFLQRLNEMGWPIAQVNAALDFWGRQPQMALQFRPLRDPLRCFKGHEKVRLTSGKLYCRICNTEKARNSRREKQATA